jgi:hypothetical protein
MTYITEAFIAEAKKIQDILTPGVGMSCQYEKGDDAALFLICSDRDISVIADTKGEGKYILIPSLGWLVRKLGEHYDASAVYSNQNAPIGERWFCVYGRKLGDLIYADTPEMACLLALNKILGR